jgi:hypothetical protein
MAGRRFLLLVAVLMGLTALAASVAPRDPSLRDRAERERRATPSVVEPTPEETPSEATVARVEELSATEAPQRVTAERGELIELHVSADTPDAVAIRGLDEVQAVDPDSPAIFALLAERPGSYPVVLLESGRRIGTFVISD